MSDAHQESRKTSFCCFHPAFLYFITLQQRKKSCCFPAWLCLIMHHASSCLSIITGTSLSPAPTAVLPCLSLCSLQTFPSYPSAASRSSLLIPLQPADLPCLSLCSLQTFPAYPSAACRPSQLIPLQPADLPFLQAKYIFEYLLRKKITVLFRFPCYNH